jgi:hypothetical protein
MQYSPLTGTIGYPDFRWLSAVAEPVNSAMLLPSLA